MSNSAAYAGLYVGSTTHARPNGQSRFRYRLFSLLLDIDHPDTRSASLLTFERPGLLSFYAKDHGDRSGEPLRPWAESIFKSAGVNLEGGPIRLLAMPRVFGFVFNPLSVFFGYGPDSQLRGVIYEVQNTFGESHCYVAAAGFGETHAHTAEKKFHVSPFFDVSGRYEFALRPPGEDFSLKITKKKDGATDHVAIWTVARRPLNNIQLLRAWLSSPLLTFWVVASIHWQALRVLLKGAKYHPKPQAPAHAVTVVDSRRSEPNADGCSRIVDPLVEHI